MSEQHEESTMKVLEASEEDVFYAEWGRETFKNNLTFANEVLRQLVTLSSSLLGGAIAFLEKTNIPPTYIKVILIFLFLSLIASFLGLLPYEEVIDIRNPKLVRKFKRRALNIIRIFLYTSATILSIAFGVAIAGVVISEV